MTCRGVYEAEHLRTFSHHNIIGQDLYAPRALRSFDGLRSLVAPHASRPQFQHAKLSPSPPASLHLSACVAHIHLPFSTYIFLPDLLFSLYLRFETTFTVFTFHSFVLEFATNHALLEARLLALGLPSLPSNGCTGCKPRIRSTECRSQRTEAVLECDIV